MKSSLLSSSFTPTNQLIMDRMTNQLRRCAEGNPPSFLQILYVESPPGYGKTSWLRQSVAWLNERDPVLKGRVQMMETVLAAIPMRNYHKQRSKVHLKVQRQRQDWAMKLARCVVASHDVVVYEDLQVKNLVKNHYPAKSILDAGWSQFTRWLNVHGSLWGKAVVAVRPQHTTQDCAHCGHRVFKTLSTRTHRCPQCGFETDRDRNAALNIS
jgi:IS605 OrfB family transposase